jgi:hypothetical protein
VEAGHISTVKKFTNFVNVGVILVQDFTIELRISVIVTVDRDNGIVSESITDSGSCTHEFVVVKCVVCWGLVLSNSPRSLVFHR